MAAYFLTLRLIENRTFLDFFMCTENPYLCQLLGAQLSIAELQAATGLSRAWLKTVLRKMKSRTTEKPTQVMNVLNREGFACQMGPALLKSTADRSLTFARLGPWVPNPPGE